MQKKSITQEQVVSEIKRIAARLEQNYLTIDRFSRESRLCSVAWIETHLGPWSRIVELAGLHPAPNHPLRYTEAELLLNLVEIANRLGRPPGHRDLNGKRPSYIPYKHRWGTIQESWKRACDRFGDRLIFCARPEAFPSGPPQEPTAPRSEAPIANVARSVSLSLPFLELLDFVSPLSDDEGPYSGQTKFRHKLLTYAPDITSTSEYINVCLHNREQPQQMRDDLCRALQDLVNHVGTLIGFDVTFGRYSSGPDGIWTHGDWGLLVETKTSDSHGIDLTRLAHAALDFQASRAIAETDKLHCLCVVGRAGRNFEQLRADGSKRSRVISVASLLTFAEFVEQRLFGVNDFMALIEGSDIFLDRFVEMIKQAFNHGREARNQQTTRSG